MAMHEDMPRKLPGAWKDHVQRTKPPAGCGALFPAKVLQSALHWAEMLRDHL